MRLTPFLCPRPNQERELAALEAAEAAEAAAARVQVQAYGRATARALFLRQAFCRRLVLTWRVSRWSTWRGDMSIGTILEGECRTSTNRCTRMY